MECYQIFIFTLLLTLTSAVSWSSKHVERSHKVAAIEDEGRYGYPYIEVDCVDKRRKCSSWKNRCTRNIIRYLCPDTCNVCRAQLPVDCKLTEFGCCWDNVSIAKGPYNQGCPLCADRYSECKYFKNRCGDSTVKHICPVTCGIRCQQCEDNKYQAVVCPLYKQYGFCELSRDLMQKMCSRTCGFCAS